MDALLNISRTLDSFCSRIAKLAVWLIPILMLVIVSDVTLRRWFVIGSTKLQELEWHLHGALFLLCLGWTYLRGGHVRIELLSEKWTPRTRAWVELTGTLVFLMPYIIAILYFGADYVVYSWAYNEASSSPTGLTDRWIIKSMILVGFSLLGLAATAKLADCFVFLFGSDEQSHATRFAKTNKAAHGGQA